MCGSAPSHLPQGASPVHAPSCPLPSAVLLYIIQLSAKSYAAWSQHLVSPSLRSSICEMGAIALASRGCCENYRS